MKISEICIERPVFAWVMTLGLILVGCVYFMRLPVQLYPKFEHPVVTIETRLPGAGAEIIETSITRIIEESVSTIDGIDHVQSTSQTEESKVQVFFKPEKDLDSAVNDIRDKIGKEKQNLPPEHQPSIITRTGAGDTSIVLSLMITGTSPDNKKDDLGEWAEFARDEIEKDLESIQGVSQVKVIGSGLYVMHIYIDPIKLASNGISVQDVMEAIRKHNFERPAGTIRTADREYVITTISNLEKPVQFEDMSITEKEGHVIKIRDIGRVEMTPEEKHSRSRFNGRPSVSIIVYKQTTANPVDISDAVEKKLTELQKKLKPGMSLKVGFNNARFIKSSIHEVYKSLFEAMFFVTLVVLVFLQSFRSSLIPLVTIPVSLIGSFFFIYIFDYTLNMMTLMALVLAIGLVVDDAIVVLENTHRYIEKGMSPMKAAYVSINEIGFAIIAMTLTLAAVYAPIAIAKGIVGKILIEFAITLACAVLISGFAAITLSPMMCSRILQSHKTEKKLHPYIAKIKDRFPIEKWLDDLALLYKTYLKLALRNKFWVLSGSILIGLIALGVYMPIPKSIFSKEDRGIITIKGEAPQTSTIEYTDKYVKRLDDLLADIPEIDFRDVRIENITAYTMTITLKEKMPARIRIPFINASGYRPDTKKVMDVIKQRFNKVSGINARVDESSSTSNANKLEFGLIANKNIEQLLGYSHLLNGLIKNAGILDKSSMEGFLSNQLSAREEFVVTIDPKADLLRVDPGTVADTIEALVKGKKAATFRKSGHIYDVKVEKEQVESIDEIKKIYVRARSTQKEGGLIPLAELIKIDTKMGFPNIIHYNRSRYVDQVLNLRQGIGISEGIKVVEELKKNNIPDEIYLQFIGGTKQYMEESSTLALIFFLSICFIYLVLAAQFESWRDPFIILLSVPFSLAGGVFGVALMKDPVISMYGSIGFVTLIGLITKHGIMMVDFANKLRLENGLSISDAIIEASQLRLRPILMTTFAMILGVFPMVIATGASAETRHELGLVITGGLVVGTLLTLFVVPCVYTLITKRRLQRTSIQ